MESRKHEDTFAEFVEGETLFRLEKVATSGRRGNPHITWSEWEVVLVQPGKVMLLKLIDREYDISKYVVLDARDHSRSHLPEHVHVPWSCGYHKTQRDAVGHALVGVGLKVKDARHQVDMVSAEASALSAWLEGKG